MPSTTADRMYYTDTQLDEVFSWVTCHGGWYNFTASSCGKCKATVNVIDNNCGWFCPCGSYNSLPWYGSQIPHEHPTYGPKGLAIQAAAARSPTLWRIHAEIFTPKSEPHFEPVWTNVVDGGQAKH